jgi:hypothetical protein
MLLKDIKIGDIVEYRGRDRGLWAEHVVVTALLPHEMMHAPGDGGPHDRIHAEIEWDGQRRTYWMYPTEVIPVTGRCLCDTCYSSREN